jgi:hypothetical protein
MKVRHAPALALLGWYLMLPPADLKTCPAADAPISKWDISQSFDTASDCETSRSRSFNEVIHGLAQHQFKGTCGDAKMDPIAAQITLARCIATDDPRLKEK